MGGGGGPTTTFSLDLVGGKTPTTGGEQVTDGHVDQSNTFLFDFIPGTAGADDQILRVSRSTAPTDGSTPWQDTVVEPGEAPALDGGDDDDGAGNTGMECWSMSDNGTAHLFGRTDRLTTDINQSVLGVGLEPSAEGVSLGRSVRRVLENAQPANTGPGTEDEAAPATTAGMGRNVIVHPNGSVGVAVGNFDQFPNQNGANLQFRKYEFDAENGIWDLADRTAPGFNVANAFFGYSGGRHERGLGNELDMGGDFLLIGSKATANQLEDGTGLTGNAALQNADVNLVQLVNLDSDVWINNTAVDGGMLTGRAGFFGFPSADPDARPDGAPAPQLGEEETEGGTTAKITSDGEHVLYTTPGDGFAEDATSRFRILKTRPEFDAMTEVSNVVVDVPQDVRRAGAVGDIETIDDDGNILVVIDGQVADAGDGELPAPRLLAYAGQPDNLRLINNIQFGEGGGTITDIKITKAARNLSLTNDAIKSPQPEENVLVTVTGDVTLGSIGVITFNLNN